MNDGFNITLFGIQGDPITVPIQFWNTRPDPDATPPVIGVPKDISGFTFMFSWKRSYEDSDLDALWIYNWTIGDGTSGATSLTIPAAKTAPVEAKSQTFWDLKSISVPGTDRTTELAGTIVLRPTVTQRSSP